MTDQFAPPPPSGEPILPSDPPQPETPGSETPQEEQASSPYSDNNAYEPEVDEPEAPTQVLSQMSPQPFAQEELPAQPVDAGQSVAGWETQPPPPPPMGAPAMTDQASYDANQTVPAPAPFTSDAGTYNAGQTTEFPVSADSTYGYGAPDAGQYAPGYAPVQTAPAPEKKKRSKKPLIITLSAIAVVVIAIVAVFGFQELSRSNAYDAAAASFEAGDYAQAEQGFMDLGDYRDSSDRARIAGDHKTYEEAKALYDEGDYLAAQEKFESLQESDFTDIEEWVNKCGYALAEELYDDGDVDAAYDAFVALGSYSDSADRANAIKYEIAEELLANGEPEEAYDMFVELGDYSDSSERAQGVKYHIAERYLQAGDPEKAYEIFLELGDYNDSAARAAAIVQPFPASGVLYQAEGTYYEFAAIEIDYKFSSGGAYYKIYNGETLVATLFCNANSTARVYLTPGEYMIKEGTGDTWFGEPLAFGKNGRYSIMTYDDTGKDSFALNDGDLVTITMNTGTSGNVSERGEDYSSF